MVAKLWANQIILGTRKFSQVPTKLKDAVREILLNENRDDLIE